MLNGRTQPGRVSRRRIAAKGNLWAARNTREDKMLKEIVWQEFNKSDRLVTKRKSFKTAEALEKFIEKLTEKDNFYTILATC